MHKIIESNSNTTQSQNIIGGFLQSNGGIFVLFLIFFKENTSFLSVKATR